MREESACVIHSQGLINRADRHGAFCECVSVFTNDQTWNGEKFERKRSSSANSVEVIDHARKMKFTHTCVDLLIGTNFHLNSHAVSQPTSQSVFPSHIIWHSFSFTFQPVPVVCISQTACTAFFWSKTKAKITPQDQRRLTFNYHLCSHLAVLA